MAPTTEISRSVALVGRPNVGKSRLFNRLVGRRMSIVHDQPGVTRDLLTADVEEGRFLLMDTGGIGLFDAKLTPKVIADAVEEQVAFAIASASLVLLVADAAEGCVPLDLEVAGRLRAAGKKVVVVANKADTPARDAARDEFYELGYGDPVLVSAEHGRGVDFLLRRILAELGPPPEIPPADTVNPIRIALAGRPNVGKSSLGNRLLAADKLVVSEVAGTTRDPVRARLAWRDPQGVERLFELADTAGRRAATKRDTLEFLSHSRAQEILAATDVVFLVIDATQGVTRIDLQLAGELGQFGAGIVLVINKWDLALEAFRQGPMGDYEDEREFRGRFQAAVRRALFFLPDPPLLFVSAKTGFRTDELLSAAAAVHARAGAVIPTARLNRALHDLLAKRPPRPRSGKLFKCYYATQVARRPIRFRLFCNTDEPLEDGYVRYLAKGLHDAFDLAGVPLFLELVGKPKQANRGFYAPQGAAPGDLPSPSAKAGSPKPGTKSRGPKPSSSKRWGTRLGGPRAGKAGPTRNRRKAR